MTSKGIRCRQNIPRHDQIGERCTGHISLLEGIKGLIETCREGNWKKRKKGVLKKLDSKV